MREINRSGRCGRRRSGGDGEPDLFAKQLSEVVQQAFAATGVRQRPLYHSRRRGISHGHPPLPCQRPGNGARRPPPTRPRDPIAGPRDRCLSIPRRATGEDPGTRGLLGTVTTGEKWKRS